MNTNRLLIALVVLVGLGAAVVVTLRSRETVTTVAAPDAKLPAIKKEDVTALEIIKPDKTTIALAKKDNVWSLTAPVAAKADTSAVDAVLEKLSELEVSGVAASRKENHKRLQVDATTGIRVKAKAGDKSLIDLWVGESKSGGTMVRLEGEDPVLAVRGSIRYAFDKEVKMFRDRVVTDIEPKDLTSVVIESQKGTFRFEKPAEKWQQAKLGKGEKAIERFSDSKVQSLVSSVARLRASDFGDPAENIEALGFNTPSSKVTLTDKTGKVTVLELGRERPGSNDYYLRVSGNPVVYRISKFTAERMMPEAKAFQEDEKKEGAEPAPQMPTAGMGGENQIPPEVMRQLQQQMQMQQGGGGHP
jgi:hypothetical protein